MKLKLETIYDVNDLKDVLTTHPKANDNVKLLLSLYLEGACVRSDIATVKCKNFEKNKLTTSELYIINF